MHLDTLWRCWLAALIALSACVTLETGSDPGVPVSWSIERVGGPVVGCPETWVTARIVMADPSNLAVRHVEDFACDDGRGETPEVRPNTYTSWIEFLDLDDHIMATSLQTSVAAGASMRPIASTVYVDGGYAALSWSWDRSSEACDDFYDLVEMTLNDGRTLYSHGFACRLGGGLSSPYPAGTYSVHVGPGLFSLKHLPDIVIEAPNRITTIPTVML